MKSVVENNGCRLIDTKWTTRDKLYLVSSVLLNGDQNWSLISEQLSKIHDFENKKEENNELENTRYSLSVRNLVVAVF
jgi:hypothetical protein